MKKVLLTTSALAGASLLAAAPASAEAPQMTFSGALAYEFIFFGGDVAAAGTGTNISANEQQSELVWDARGSADNGLNYRANIQWRALAGNTGAFDESWLDFTGSFGRIYLGSEDGVGDLLGNQGGHSVQVGTWGTDGNNAARHVNFIGLNTGTHYYQSHAGMTGDANKLGYVTPDFSGFQAGISYSPNSTTGQAAGGNNDANAHAVELAAQWSGSFDDVSLALGGSYGLAEDQSSTNGTRPPNDVGAYAFGGLVGFAGFQVAAMMFENDDSNCAAATSTCDDGNGWNVGANYNFGPGSVSAMYQQSEDDTDGNGRSDESTIIHAGVNYTIADGLSTHLNAYWFDFENEQGSGVQTNSNDATVVILGTRITF